MNRLKRTWGAAGAVALFAMLSSGCIGVHSLVKPEYKNLKPVRSAAEIEITYRTPEKEHLIIGEISLNFQKTPREEVIEKLKEEAARLGADGIILEQLTTYQNNWSVSGQDPNYASKVGATRYRMGGAIYRYLRESR